MYMLFPFSKKVYAEIFKVSAFPVAEPEDLQHKSNTNLKCSSLIFRRSLSLKESGVVLGLSCNCMMYSSVSF